MAFVLTGKKPLGLKTSPGGNLFSWLPCEKKEWDPGEPTEVAELGGDPQSPDGL